MGRQLALQPNGNYAIISTVTDSFCGVNYTKEEVLEYFINRRLKECEREIKELKEQAETLFTDPDRNQSWEKSVQWHYLRNLKGLKKTDETWEYIKAEVDPNIDSIVDAMKFNDEGEWID